MEPSVDQLVELHAADSIVPFEKRIQIRPSVRRRARRADVFAFAPGDKPQRRSAASATPTLALRVVFWRALFGTRLSLSNRAAPRL